MKNIKRQIELYDQHGIGMLGTELPYPHVFDQRLKNETVINRVRDAVLNQYKN